MAVLARMVGIPARVVVGYTQGSFIGNNTWQVKTSDAHAWPELYFPNAGWLRFEPTPPNSVGLAGQATASAPPYSTPLSDSIGNVSPNSGGSSSSNFVPQSNSASNRKPAEAASSIRISSSAAMIAEENGIALRWARGLVGL